jgi:hypothetical protein
MRIRGGTYLAGTVIALALLAGCSRSFNEVDAAELQRIWAEEARYADATWWYLGTSENFHYLREDRPLISTRYKIRRDEVDLVDIKEFRHSWSERNRIGLKKVNLVFDEDPKRGVVPG